jgi:hypothetical protein
MLDWSRLKTYQNSKYKSFEELCYQLAKRLHGSHGWFTSIDDSGGGEGVEFYLTLANGDECGWQAKSYWPNPRLDASRKRSIINSLETSKKNLVSFNGFFAHLQALLQKAKTMRPHGFRRL